MAGRSLMWQGEALCCTLIRRLNVDTVASGGDANCHGTKRLMGFGEMKSRTLMGGKRILADVKKPH